MSNKYDKTDYELSEAITVFRWAYIVIEAICFIGALGGLVILFLGLGVDGILVFLSGLLCAIFFHLIYVFGMGFFELIKHAREIRNELLDMRTRSTSSPPMSSEHPVSAGATGGMRYDEKTHQYVKA